MALTLFARRRTESPPAQPRPEPRSQPASSQYEPSTPVEPDPDPLRRLLQCEQFGTVLARQNQWPQHPDRLKIIEAASQAIDGRFAMVPEGLASLTQTAGAQPGGPEMDFETEAFLLQCHTVTNAAFQMFVDDGGYEKLDYWPQDIWPHIIDFRDQTHQPGPRFWRNGRHERRLADHPVVGVCYYEAAAYAAWAGYRLPAEPEWQMAASWRIRSSADVLRRYPWGDALDVRRCNIWASGVGATAPVNAYDKGAAPNGVLQLVGNVWEWTASDFQIADDQGRMLIGETAMKSIRGGAFDTYFPSQATSCFRTGLANLARTSNAGFRCALDLAWAEARSGGEVGGGQ